MPKLVPSVVPVGGMRDRPQPTLRTDGLTLRPFHAGDAPALVAVYSAGDIQQWHFRSMTDGEAHRWIEAAAESWARETAADWAVVDDDDDLVGRAGFRTINLDEGAAEIAYWTAPRSRGRNIAVRAADAVSRWMFEEVGLHRIELNHSTANRASCRVAEKAGFRYEGTRRQQVLHLDGWHDMHLHGRLAGDGPVAAAG